MSSEKIKVGDILYDHTFINKYVAKKVGRKYFYIKNHFLYRSDRIFDIETLTEIESSPSLHRIKLYKMTEQEAKDKRERLKNESILKSIFQSDNINKLSNQQLIDMVAIINSK